MGHAAWRSAPHRESVQVNWGIQGQGPEGLCRGFARKMDCTELRSGKSRGEGEPQARGEGDKKHNRMGCTQDCLAETSKSANIEQLER